MNKNNIVHINILLTSDIHGTIYPIHYRNNEPAEIGLAKLATRIIQERNQHEHVIVIDNGDFIQGTPFTYYYAKYIQHKKNPMSLIANYIGYDAAVIGNHEFNYGMDVLNKAILNANMPYLSANILNKHTKDPYFGKPYIIKHIHPNIKVAILGVTTHYIPNWEQPPHIKDLLFEDALETTKKWVSLIHNQEQPDLLVVAYHGGFERDLQSGEPTEILTGENQGYAMCQEIDGIDILLTGHQHRSIANTKVNGVTVVQPGSNGHSLGKVRVELEQNKDRRIIKKCQSELLSVKDVQTDEKALSLVSDYENQTQQWLDQPIGTIIGDMQIHTAMQTRLQDNPFIEFINKVQMEVAGVHISCTSLFHNESSGFPNQITMRDIVSNYIYPNTLKVIRITGKDIKDALELSAKYFTLNNEGDIIVNPAYTTPKPQHYNYDMWEGVSYILNISKPVGERVVSLQYDGSPIHFDQEYDVVMNNYRASGGGNYFMYQNKPIIKDIPIDMSELIANYILERGTIEATTNRNWKVTK
ncbi:bifunctional metallophosphatase/5'-nucleotidase [Bacillus pseudomycoides]|uniref:Bifunctional metallophosphatase/5'-nucleotidase n=1 Tax=Bacillus pseudomycoides TaxID=64104 RepID=A0AAJ1YX20_9BACI|nr:bifunctional UDP-sugar hydrolase/5'-nucleotidase [Bacillus pseudomycoides]MDR4325710.1 bifunctional metallophosphatase/5'-nucleotidase [Bacillus pseudomycoides]MED1535522.1 bifunctional UDP-sugar hydrolase/5'-nucleotidase [Bacillus pseudomycoides]PEK22810.1 bifunctional metallophosphatase/5'-nucleotidase [Bacillus pseudomycoides]PEK67819.1 bifunctional metallophosphatase/5'-nucleotidase [Bacillus pseudomycoides]PEP39291.1 bifunctional metallophosphatase/5'-nucleotidase [Bacillus pseudomycoi